MWAWFSLARWVGSRAGRHPRGALCVLLVLGFLVATDACAEPPVCRQPNELQACDR